MSDEAALLKAIIAHADEDTPRLVYADWLDEHGDLDRAEFIRVQCRLADMPPSDPDWVDLTERQDELIARMRCRLRALCPKLPKWFDYESDIFEWRAEPFRRGFPYLVHCSAENFNLSRAVTDRVIAGLTKLVTASTLRALSLTRLPATRLSQFLAAPAFARLNELTLQPYYPDTDYVSEVAAFCHLLATHPAMRQIRQLTLNAYIPPDALTELANAKVFDGLRVITIGSLHGPNWAIEALAKAAWFCRAERVHVTVFERASATPIIAALGNSSGLHTLELELNNNMETSGARGAIADIARGRFPALARFISHSPPDAMAAKRLARARFPALVAFESQNWIDDDGLVTLLKSEWFGRLRVLDLSSNLIGDSGVNALAAHPLARTLRVLKLGHNRFGRSALTALAKPGAFPVLTTLDLPTRAKGKPSYLARFVSALPIPNLRHLNLANWNLGDEGARALAANPAFATLTRLILSGCGIGNAGAKALFASPHLRNLVELQLDTNRITTGANALADPAVMPRLGECGLGDNKIPKKAREKLERKGLYLVT